MCVRSVCSVCVVLVCTLYVNSMWYLCGVCGVELCGVCVSWCVCVVGLCMRVIVCV